MKKLQGKIGLVLLLGVVLFAVGWACYPSLLGLWADRLYAQANQVDDSEVPDLIDRLAMLGEQGIPRLVAAMGSERKTVARAARACLLNMIESWDHPDTRPLPKIQLCVAASLANRMKYYGPDSRRHAVTLAQRMLQVSNDRLTKRESNHFLMACESILKDSQPATEENRLTDAEAPTEPAPTPIVKKTEIDEETPLSEQSLVELARLPGGNLPPALPELSGHRLAPEEGGGHATVPLLREPQALAARSLPEEETQRKDSSGTLADGSDPATDDETKPDRLPELPALRPLEPSGGAITVKTSPLYASLHDSTEKAEDRVYLLIMQLRSEDKSQADQARRELRLGGFKTIHFALAERMTDPDPQVRKKLAQILPRLKSVRAESWLKWLLRDDDPSVRREALTTLASSKDPTLLSEIAHIAQSDSDPKIRLEGQQIERRLAQ